MSASLCVHCKLPFDLHKNGLCPPGSTRYKWAVGIMRFTCNQGCSYGVTAVCRHCWSTAGQHLAQHPHRCPNLNTAGECDGFVGGSSYEAATEEQIQLLRQPLPSAGPTKINYGGKALNRKPR